MPMPRTMKPSAIMKRRATDQIVSPRSVLLIASRMNPAPIQTYHHASIRARRVLFMMADGSCRIAGVYPDTVILALGRFTPGGRQ